MKTNYTTDELHNAAYVNELRDCEIREATAMLYQAARQARVLCALREQLAAFHPNPSAIAERRTVLAMLTHLEKAHGLRGEPASAELAKGKETHGKA